jgi:DedD protein
MPLSSLRWWPFGARPDAAARPRAGARRTSRRPASHDPAALDPQATRVRARQRLIGASVLLALGVAVFALLFETEPRPADGVAAQARRDAGQVQTAEAGLPVDGAQGLVLPGAAAGAEGASSPPDGLPSGGVPAGAAVADGTVSSGPLPGTAASEPAGRTTEPATDPPREAPAPPSRDTAAPPPAVAASADAVPPPAAAAPAPRPAVTAAAPAPDAAASAVPAPTPARPSADDGARARALLEGRGTAPAPAVPAAAAGAAASVTTPRPANAAVARYVVQVGAFSDPAALRDARQRVERLGLKTYTQVVQTPQGARTRVRVGPFDSRAEAEAAAAKLRAARLPAVLLTL